jgi:hypothetical protein
MSDTTIGSCSLCGGPVTVPELWGGSVPPVPRCRSCGATARMPFGPVVPMEPPRQSTNVPLTCARCGAAFIGSHSCM